MERNIFNYLTSFHVLGQMCACFSFGSRIYLVTLIIQSIRLVLIFFFCWCSSPISPFCRFDCGFNTRFMWSAFLSLLAHRLSGFSRHLSCAFWENNNGSQSKEENYVDAKPFAYFKLFSARKFFMTFINLLFQLFADDVIVVAVSAIYLDLSIHHSFYCSFFFASMCVWCEYNMKFVDIYNKSFRFLLLSVQRKSQWNINL